MVKSFERNQPVVFQPAMNDDEPAPRAPARPAARAPSRFPAFALTFVIILSAFWIGVWGAYLWGYFGPQGLASLDIQQLALFAAAMGLPPFLFVAIAAALGRASYMGRTAEALQAAAELLFTADDTAA